MALIQYITKKREKVFLDMQDLNIIRQRINSIHDPKENVVDLDALQKCKETLIDIEYYFERVGVMISSPPSFAMQHGEWHLLFSYIRYTGICCHSFLP